MIRIFSLSEDNCLTWQDIASPVKTGRQAGEGGGSHPPALERYTVITIYFEAEVPAKK